MDIPGPHGIFVLAALPAGLAAATSALADEVAPSTDVSTTHHKRKLRLTQVLYLNSVPSRNENKGRADINQLTQIRRFGIGLRDEVADMMGHIRYECAPALPPGGWTTQR